MSAYRWRVVLREDDADMRGFFESCVNAHPDLELAASFRMLAPARDWFASHTADVLLTDLALPDGHALALLKEVVGGVARLRVWRTIAATRSVRIGGWTRSATRRPGDH